MDLSIVIPCRNHGRHLGAQLQALSNEGWAGSWEVIVVDNGSTDHSIAEAERFRDRVPNLRVVSAQECSGAAYARNEGVRLARAELVLFLDADDVVGKGYLGAMAAALERHELVCARLNFWRLNTPGMIEIWPRLWQQEGPIDELDFLAFAGAGTLGIQRSLFDEVGGFDERLRWYEEADLCWRIQLAGHRPPAFVPEAVLHLRLPSSVPAIYRQSRNYARGRRDLYSRYPLYLQEPHRTTARSVLGSLRRIRTRSDLLRASEKMGRYAGQRVALLEELGGRFSS